MKKVFLITLVQFLISGMCINAQKMTLQNGSVDFLKDQQTILVKYDYSNLAVGKFDKEDDYIAKKVADYNKDEAGKGDKWKEAWFNDRQQRFAPKFEELFNDYIKAKNLQCDQAAADAKYEMLVHTTFIEPGFNVGITSKPAFINVEVSFRETGSDKDLAVITVQNCPGRDVMGFDFDTGYRLAEAYAKLGKSLANFLLKKL
jgi:hypothetical protein